MELVPFESSHYSLLMDWISSPELNYQWGGPAYTYPLTEEQISTHCSDPDTFPFLFRVHGQYAGFIEYRKLDPVTCRICRVLVIDSFQGQGLSKSMLRLVMERAKQQTNCHTFSLCVFDHNEAAKALYKSLGFETVSVEKRPEKICNEYWTAVEMVART